MTDTTLLDDLKKEIHSGNAVFVAGAGVATAVCGNQQVGGFPVATWPGLIRHGIGWCRSQGFDPVGKAADLMLSQVDTGVPALLLMAGHLVADSLKLQSEGVYRRWLADTLGSLRASEPGIARTLCALPGIVATLNYDSLIEQATDRRAFTWMEQDKVQAVLRGEYPESVLHLYGHYDSPDSVMLDLESYAKVQADPHTRAILTTFTIGRTLVFVGCAGPAEDPNFSRLLEWGGEIQKESSYRHFLLCTQGELAQMRSMIGQGHNIFALVYGSDRSELGPFLESLMPDTGAPAIAVSAPVPGFNEALYARKLKDRYQRIRLETVEMTGGQYRPLELLKVFVPQSVRECQEYLPQVLELPKEQLERLREHGELDTALYGRREDEELRRRYLQQPPRDSLVLADDPAFPKVVILGDPGSGKSSLLQALALKWAELPPEARRDVKLPVLVELRSFATAYEKRDKWDILDYLATDPVTVMAIPRDVLDQRLREGRIAMLFDGLDEVFDPRLREEISLAVLGLASEYGGSGSRFLLTSRPIGYRGDLFRNGGFNHFMLQDLEPNVQIPRFLQRWHEETYAESERKDAEAKRDRLATAIQSSPAIRMLAGNPLLLTMMALLNRNQDLPRDRAQLYDQCSRLLLYHWDVEKILKDTDSGLEAGAIGLTEKQDILRRLAREMQGGQGKLGTAISVERLEQVFTEALTALAAGNARALGRALIRQLRERNFILCFLGGDTYGFVHRTFLEYFVALDIKRRFEYDQGALQIDVNYLKNDLFLKRWPEETWHEALRLVASLLNPKVVDEILAALVPVRDPNRKYLPQFLAAQCIQEVRDRRAMRTRDIEIRDALLKMTGARSYRYSWQYGFWEETLSTVRQAAAQALLSGYREDAEALECLKNRVSSDENDSVRQAMLHALAAAYQEKPDTAGWLKERAVADWNDSVRQSAIQEVARLYGTDPETPKWLKALVTGSDHHSVRQSALRALASYFRTDPQTPEILKERAVADENWAVRQAALQNLPSAYRDDNEILPIVKDRAVNDESEFVRQSALQALAIYYKTDPETIPILMRLGEKDTSIGVRQAAIQALAGSDRDNGSITEWLHGRAVEDPAPILRQAVLQAVVNYYRAEDSTLPWLRQRAMEDADPNVRQAAVQCVATAYRAEPSTLPWLLERLADDRHDSSRHAAVLALAKAYSEDSTVLRLLRASAADDASPKVRKAAVQALPGAFLDDPAALAWLMERTLQDDNEQVRQAALLALATHSPDDPELLPMLKERVVEDPRPLVRQAAVQALATRKTRDADVLAILKERVAADESANVRQVAVRAIVDRWRDEPEIRSWLEERITADEDFAAVNSATQAYAAVYCDDTMALAWLRELAIHGEREMVRSAAVSAIANAHKSDPDTLTWLKDRVNADPSWLVGQAAVQAVRSTYHGDPDTKVWLKKLAESAASEYVRQAAIVSLSTLGRDDGEVLKWIVAISTGAEHWMVRAAALNALANVFHNAAATNPTLVDRAVQDPGEFVRQAAVRALALSFPNQASTRPLLRDRAVNDPNWLVRQTALQALAATYAHDPETTPLVQERVSADESDLVRKEAAKILAVLAEEAVDDAG